MNNVISSLVFSLKGIVTIAFTHSLSIFAFINSWSMWNPFQSVRMHMLNITYKHALDIQKYLQIQSKNWMNILNV